MWGKNADDQTFHYFVSMADGRYRCGKTQRAKSIKAVELPEGRCPVCFRHFQAETKSSGFLNSGANAQNSSPGKTLVKPQEPVVARPKKESKPAPTRRPIDREAEKRYLRQVAQTLEQMIAEYSGVRRGARQAVARSTTSNFIGAAVAAWRLRNSDEVLEILRSQQTAPYFGRFDFLEDDAEGEESFYIGRSTVPDEMGDLLVLDWRAPICSLYYGYNVGRASYRAPLGMIHGDLQLKRQYRIEKGEITAIYDANHQEGTEDNAADEMLVSLLKRNTTGNMRQIVQSIQAEQDAIIRSDGDVIVVQGPAGSGKTVVALHRAAYLLYFMRMERERLAQRFEHISSQRMVVFSPNSIFSDYISRVLPDLHEGQIRQVILEDLLHQELMRHLRREGLAAGYQVETREEYYASVLVEESEIEFRKRERSAGFKGSYFILTAIDELMQKLEQRVEETFFDIEWSGLGGGDRIFFGREEMIRQFRANQDRLSLIERIDAVLKEFSQRISDTSQRAYTQASTARQLQRERDRLAEKLKPLREVGGIDLYLQLWRDADALRNAWLQDQAEHSLKGEEIEEIAASTRENLKQRIIAYDDVVPLLLIQGCYRGFPQTGEIDHAVIDEAQDYSIPHYEYIRRCLPARTGLTIVGDLNQALSPLLTLSSYDGLKRMFGSRLKRLELTRSYRSSCEITDFAGQILRGGARIDNVRRSGSKPKLLRADPAKDRGEVIEALLKQLSGGGYNSIVVLCRTAAECRKLYDRLHPALPVALTVEKTDRLKQGVSIMPVHLAKGLEFDVVVLHNAGRRQYHREAERKLLYTACTRALHELYICYTGDLSPLFDQVDPQLYVEVSSSVRYNSASRTA